MFKAIGRTLSNIFSALRFVLHPFWFGGERVLRRVAEAVPAVAVGLMGLPAAAVRSVLGIKPPLPDAAVAGRDAAAKAEAAKSGATATGAVDPAIADFRRLARAVGRGRTPAESTYERLPPALAAYLRGLTQDEARVLGGLSVELLAATLAGQRTQDGVRTPDDVRADSGRERVAGVSAGR